MPDFRAAIEPGVAAACLMLPRFAAGAVLGLFRDPPPVAAAFRFRRNKSGAAWPLFAVFPQFHMKGGSAWH